MPACACVLSALPGGCRQGRAARGRRAGESRGRGCFGAAPGPALIPHVPGEAVPARACVRECGTGACVPLAGKDITWHEERPAQRNLPRAGTPGAPAQALPAFCPVTEGSGRPQLPAAPVPTTQPPWALRGGEGRSAPCVSPPPLRPGGKGAAQGSHARWAGSCHAAWPLRLLFLQARRRDQALPVRWEHLADCRRAVGSGAVHGGGCGMQTSPAVLSRGKGSLAGHSDAPWTGSVCRRTWSNKAGQELAGACKSDPGSCHNRVLPAGRARRGVGTGGGRGWWQYVGACPERGTAAVGASATSPANTRRWSQGRSWEAWASRGAGRTASRQGGCRQRLLPRLPPRPVSFAPAPEAAVTRAEGAERALDRGLASPAAHRR